MSRRSTSTSGKAAATGGGGQRSDTVGTRAAARSALDVMLTDAAIEDGGVRRFIKPTAAVRVAAALARRPGRVVSRVAGLGQELARVAAGRSELTPPKGDRRFADPAWSENWLLRRLLQSYLATVEIVDELIDDAELDWRTERQARFAAGNILDGLAPTNFPWSNPGGAARDRRQGRREPRRGRAPLRARHVQSAAPAGQRGHEQVRARREPRALAGIRRAADRGVRADPLPAEHRARARGSAAVRAADDQPLLHPRHSAGAKRRRASRRRRAAGVHGLLVQPRRRAGAFRPRHLCAGCARGARRRRRDNKAVCGAHQRRLLGRHHHRGCALGHLAATESLDDVASLTLWVCALDNARAGTTAALASRELAAAAVAESARKGYLDGRALAGVFAWLRPNDLIWNYVVNNYLLGKEPPAFDILYWNQDSVRLAAGLHRDFVHLALENSLTRAGALQTLGTPLDLGAIDLDSLHRRWCQRPHRALGERLPQHAAARRLLAVRSVHERPHPGTGQPPGPASRSTYRVDRRRPRGGTRLACAGRHEAGQLVAGLRRRG